MIGQQPMAQSAAPGSVIPLPTLTESAVGGTPTQSGLSQPNPASPPPPGGSPGAAGFNGTMTTGTLPLSGQAFPTPTTSTSTSTSTLGVASAASQASGTVSASPEQFTGAASREDVGLFGVGVGALAAVAAMGMM